MQRTAELTIGRNWILQNIVTICLKVSPTRILELYLIHIWFMINEKISFADDIQFVGFCLLPFVLPSCGRKLTQTVEDINDTDEEGTANARSSTNMAKRKRSKGNAVTIKRRKTQMTTLKSSDLDALRSMLLIKPVIQFKLLVSLSTILFFTNLFPWFYRKTPILLRCWRTTITAPPSFWHWDQSQIWSFSISS